MEKITLLLICIISILSLNTFCVNAKEPDKTPCTLYHGNAMYLSSMGYVINGENYYRMDSIFSANYGRPETEQINVRFNEAENCIEAYYTKYSGVPAKNLLTAEPVFCVYEIKRKNEWGVEETFWATHDLETGEKNAYVKKDPYVHMRDKIYNPRKETVKVKNVDGECYTIDRYAIDKSYYYNIEDLAELLKCSVAYSEKQDACFVITGSESYIIQYSEKAGRYFVIRDYEKYFKILPDIADVPDRVAYTMVASAPPRALQYIYDNGDDTFSTFGKETQSGEGGTFYTIRTYGKSDFCCIDTKKVYVELDYYCGYFSGEKYNYIGYGANNPEEIPDKEIIRIVKYDKNFNRISSVSLTTEQCFSIDITYGGTMRMAENGNELAVHTSRLRRKTDDGLNHQSQLSLIIDTDTMAIKNYTGEFQSNHVSHSFNQYVKYDGDEIVYVDHGDAYPRAIVLNSSYGKKINLYDIPGEIGDNYTGVDVGGFEISPENYLVTFNTDDFSGGLSSRNACLAICNKKTQTTKVITLSDCFGKETYACAPYIIKINDNRFILLWSESEKDYSQITKYAEIDGDGNFLTEIRTSDKTLPEYMQPMYMDNAIYWYKDFYVDLSTGVAKCFYKLDLDPLKENPIRVMYNGEEVQFDQKPISENGRTLVPLRAIFEKIGASVEWNGDTQTVTATKGDTSISLTINNTTAYKNGQAITLDVPSKALNGRTLVPVRFVSDCFGVGVDWVQETRTVILTSK